MRTKTSKKNVLVYGAGEAGRQLVISLKNNPEFKVVGILDDNNQLENKVVLGLKVYSSSNLNKLANTKNVSLVFLAIPSLGRSRRNQIIKKLSEFKLVVKTLPSVSEIIDGRVTISDIKDLNIDDLLNREQVKPDIKLLNKNIKEKVVLVTGAGGSIGSELCRQIIKSIPSKLLLLELNEFALYEIYEELITYEKKQKIIPLLVDSQDQSKLETIFDIFIVDTVYHNSAYKLVS